MNEKPWDTIKCLASSEGNVWKFIFTKADAIAEAVLYRYPTFEERTVICCSVQSGCPVGCTFCGTGKRFIRNLTWEEIVGQVDLVLHEKGLGDIANRGRRFQIMFMSMGEPLLNWDNVEKTIEHFYLNRRWYTTEYLVSTIGPDMPGAWMRLTDLSVDIPTIGLQLSVHRAFDASRSLLIPYRNKLDLQELRDMGLLWWQATGRMPFVNYCIDGTNDDLESAQELSRLFSPVCFNFTFSVVCRHDATQKDAAFRDLDRIRLMEKWFIDRGYNTRIFDPAGQDDIGGGCGQLFGVQRWLRERGE